MKPPSLGTEILICNLRMCLHPERRFFFSSPPIDYSDLRFLLKSPKKAIALFLGESRARHFHAFLRNILYNCTCYVTKGSPIEKRKKQQLINTILARTIAITRFLLFRCVTLSSSLTLAIHSRVAINLDG